MAHIILKVLFKDLVKLSEINIYFITIRLNLRIIYIKTILNIYVGCVVTRSVTTHPTYGSLPKIQIVYYK